MGFALLLALFWAPPSLWLFSGHMLHYLHQLIVNFVCVLFSGEQKVYSGFY